MSEETKKSTSKKILLAEDDFFLSRMLEVKLSQEGYTVVRAADGEEVLEAMDKEPFGLLLLDLIMPKMNGFTVLTKLREKHNDVPVIVVSNLGQKEDVDQVMALGVRKYLIKSNAPMEEVLKEIKSVLG